MTTQLGDDLVEVKEAVRLLRRAGVLTAAQLAEEMGCSRMRAIRLLSVAAAGDIWGPNIFQRQQGTGPLSTTLQFLYHEPVDESPRVLAALRSLQDSVVRLEARLALTGTS
jgi:hypothetical protein